MAGRAGIAVVAGRRAASRASPPSTRNSTWSTGCRSGRTSSSATSCRRPASRSARRPGVARRELLARLGHPEISPSGRSASLSAAGKQIVSVARALSRDARLIVMDEPSAVLDGEEVEKLFHIVGDLAAAGVAVVYISHRLEEIRRIGDRITVLKDGRTVATGLDARTTPTSELIRLMTGRSIEYVFPPRSGRPAGAGGGAAAVGAGPVRAAEFDGRQLRRPPGRDRRPGRTCRRRPQRDRRDHLRRAARRQRNRCGRRGPAAQRIGPVCRPGRRRAVPRRNASRRA